MSESEPARELVARIEALKATGFAGEAFRHVAQGHDPISTVGARAQGGRWNPPESFGTLYLGLDRATVADELHRAARRQGLTLDDFLPREVHRFEISLETILDLREEQALNQAGLDQVKVKSDNAVPCQAIGTAAHHLGHEGILAPSAAGPGTVLAVFIDQLKSNSVVRAVQSEIWSTPPSPREP